MSTIPTRPWRQVPPRPLTSRRATPATFGGDYVHLATAIATVIADPAPPMDVDAARTARSVLVAMTGRLIDAASANAELPWAAARLLEAMRAALAELRTPAPVPASAAAQSADARWAGLARAATVMERQVEPIRALPPDDAAQVLADLTVLARCIPVIDDRVAGDLAAARSPAQQRLRAAAGALAPVATIGRPWTPPDPSATELALIVAQAPPEAFDLRGLDVPIDLGARDGVMAAPGPAPDPPATSLPAAQWEELPGRGWYDTPTVGGPRPTAPDRRLLPSAVAPTMARITAWVAASPALTAADARHVATALSSVTAAVSYTVRPSPYQVRVQDLSAHAARLSAALAGTLSDLDPPSQPLARLCAQVARSGALVRDADPPSGASIRAALPALVDAAATAVHQAASSPATIVTATLSRQPEPEAEQEGTLSMFTLEDLGAAPTAPVLDRERGGDRDPAVVYLLTQARSLRDQAPQLAADAPRVPSPGAPPPSAAAGRAGGSLGRMLDEIDAHAAPGRGTAPYETPRPAGPPV